jgi:hypothetical protein
MKFDASRAESVFRELGDPRYAGPDGERQAADFVASRFKSSGLSVERREVSGSRFLQRAAPWVGWLGYGLLVTAVYVLALQRTVLPLLLALVLSCSSVRWLLAVVSNQIRLSPGRARREVAPVLIASLPGEVVAPIRVVFQAAISVPEVDPFHFLIGGRAGRLVIGLLLPLPMFWCMAVLTIRYLQFVNPGKVDARVGHDLLVRYVYPVFLALVWTGILILLSEHRWSRATPGRSGVERRGLALLLELARTWPRTGSRGIEPVFVAAGGQRADHAGSREIIRLLESEWASRPTLLMLFFAPGAGDGLKLCSNARIAPSLARLAEDAARSLWLPYRGNDFSALLSVWPFDKSIPHVALVGTDHRAFFDDTIDPQVLHQAAQLATEIALRWAKTQKPTVPEPESAG